MARGVTAGVRCVRLRIEGLVQGVGFRAFVEQQATARGLDGWVRNRRDGGVEAVVSGAVALVDEMIAACRKGPSGSRVDWLEVLDEADPPPSGFRVAATA